VLACTKGIIETIRSSTFLHRSDDFILVDGGTLAAISSCHVISDRDHGVILESLGLWYLDRIPAPGARVVLILVQMKL
jgi:hypothetical protein